MCLPFPDLAERTLEQGEHAGFRYEIVRNRNGYRCGYVRVLPGHPWFGKDYDDVTAEVHGGLTFAVAGKACPTHGPEDEWWLGFDCNHGGDAPDPLLIPEPVRITYDETARLFPKYNGEVRDQGYVRGECFSLAEQAGAALDAARRIP